MTRRHTIGLCALSLWCSTAWLTDQFMPSSASPIAAQGFRLLLVAAFSLLFLFGKRVPTPQRSVAGGCLTAVASLGMIGLPFLLFDLARGRIASTTGVLIFALLPVVFAVLPGGSDGSTNVHRLPYAMLGVAGILILLPIPLPRSAAGLLSLLAAMLLTAACFLWLHRLLDGLSLRVALPAICLANGLLLMLATGPLTLSGLDRTTLAAESLRALAIDLPQTILLLWLLKAIPPMQLSARYVLAPLFTVLEGLAILRPRFEARTLAGIVLLSACIWFIVSGGSREENPGLKLNYDR